MDSIVVLNIDTAAFVVGVGPEAVRKALRNGKIRKFYRLKIGQTVMMLIPFDEVRDYWISMKDEDPWLSERMEIAKRDSVVIKTEDGDLEVLAGQCLFLSH